MKITYGVILALTLGLAASSWALKRAWAATQLWETRAIAADERFDRLSTQFERLDDALGQLADQTTANRLVLDERLAQLRNLAPMETDTDETMQCLDRPVPTALDILLRDATRRAEGAGVPASGL